MNQQQLNILGAVAAVAMFLFSLQDLMNEHGEWYQRLTVRGWAALLISIFVFVLAILNNKFIKQQKADADRVIREQKADADRVRKDHETLLARAESIDSALKASNLRYNPEMGTITNIMGDVAKENSGVIGIQNIGSQGTTMTDINTQQHIYQLTKEQSQFCSYVKGVANRHQITDKGVYLLYVKGTKGQSYFPTVKEGLKMCGFHVFQEKEIDIDPKEAGPVGQITRHNDKICIIIGDNFELY